MKMANQAPNAEGIRKSRWVIIRNTYPELETTTIKTWLDWFPEDTFGKLIRKIPMCYHFKYNDIEAEVYFIAMDKPQDAKKVLSLELTGVFFNEAREMHIDVITKAIDRVGRYPSQKDRPPNIPWDQWPTWYGVIMDTNPPDDEHWWPIYAGDVPVPELPEWEGFVPPNNWEFFTQPPAAFEIKVDGKTKWHLNPNAENLENLAKDYYANIIQGKTNAHIRIYVGNKYGTTVDGKVVYPEYSDDVHLAKEPLKAIKGKRIIAGVDFGRTPAVYFGQPDLRGQWRGLHEIVTSGVGTKTLARLIKREIRIAFPDHQLSEFDFYGDPAGMNPTENEDKSSFEILQGQGIKINPDPTNNAYTRIEAGREPLELLLPNGVAGYQLSPTMKMTQKGFKTGYRYKRINMTGGSVLYDDKPDKKSKFSHIHDARQYALCGAGYGKEVTGKGKNWKTGKTFKAKTGFNPLSRT